MLVTLEKAIAEIKAGKRLLCAGEESLLSQLPKGNWIGGTIPYFMDMDGGQMDQKRIFIDAIPEAISDVSIHAYSEGQLAKIPADAYENGVSFIIIPASSPSHVRYAQDAPEFANLFLHPIIGWIAGVHLDDLGKKKQVVFNGMDGKSYDNAAIVLHGKLPSGKIANIGIVNAFEPGDGDDLVFASNGFTVKDCLVNGVKKNFATYVKEINADTRLPLVADYSGAMVNISIQTVKSDSVDLYAPVFAGVHYKLAKKLDNYMHHFTSALPKDIIPAFSCNCILNYLYSELEGKTTKGMYGPITFGEIAYQLLNQTLVYLEIK